MNPLFSFAAVLAVVTSSIASAQGVCPSQRPDHAYWHVNSHTPDVIHLDEQSDQLAKIARHLHVDAHTLSQDYEHSESIELYVDKLDRLQQHMHEMLHETAEVGSSSPALISHVKYDVRKVKTLLKALSGELSHQGFDGARKQDFEAMTHMREIISNQALPLVRNLEIELYGYALPDHNVTSRHRTLRLPILSGRRIHIVH